MNLKSIVLAGVTVMSLAAPAVAWPTLAGNTTAAIAKSTRPGRLAWPRGLGPSRLRLGSAPLLRREPRLLPAGTARYVSRPVEVCR